MRKAWPLWTVLLSGCAALGGPSEKRENLAEIYTQKAAFYLQAGKLNIALEDLKQALAYDPNYAETHGLLGVLYEQIGMLEKAKEHYRKAVELDPENLRWQDNYGRFLCFRGQPKEGFKHLKRAAEFPLYENRHIALTNAALCAMKLGDDKTAERYLQEARTFAPAFFPAIEVKILLEIRRGHIVEAQRLLEDYRRLGGPEATLRKLEEQLYQAIQQEPS